MTGLKALLTVIVTAIAVVIPMAMFAGPLVLMAVITFRAIKKNGGMREIQEQIRRTQAMNFEPSVTAMHREEPEGDGSGAMPDGEGRGNSLKRKPGAGLLPDPHFIPPKEAADSHHTVLDKCGNEGCFDEIAAGTQQEAKAARGKDAMAKDAEAAPQRGGASQSSPDPSPYGPAGPSAAGLNAKESAAVLEAGADGRKRAARYPLGYQLALAEAILQRGGRRAAGNRGTRRNP